MDGKVQHNGRNLNHTAAQPPTAQHRHTAPMLLCRLRQRCDVRAWWSQCIYSSPHMCGCANGKLQAAKKGPAAAPGRAGARTEGEALPEQSCRHARMSLSGDTAGGPGWRWRVGLSWCCIFSSDCSITSTYFGIVNRENPDSRLRLTILSLDRRPTRRRACL